MKHAGSLVAQVLVMLMGSGMGCRRAPEGTRVQHLAGAITDDDAHQGFWLEAKGQAYDNFYGTAPETLSDQSPLVQRLNAWARILDQAARRAHPERLKHVPVPLVKVIYAAKPQAFPKEIPLCFDVPFDLDSGEGKSDAYVYLTPQLWNGFRPVPFVGKEICQNVITAKDLPAYLPWINKQLTGGCALEHGNGRVFLKQACYAPIVPERLDTNKAELAKRSFKGFALSATSNVVELHTGLLQQLNEPQTVAALAHELAHLYKQSVSRPLDLQSYFYMVGQRNTNGKPQRGPAAIQQLGKELIDLPFVFAPLPPALPGQDLQGPGFEVLFKLAQILNEGDKATEALCGEQSSPCNRACNTFKQSTSGLDWASFSPFPWHLAQSPQATQSFMALQGGFKACAQQLVVGQGRLTGMFFASDVSPLPLAWNPGVLDIRTGRSLWQIVELGQKIDKENLAKQTEDEAQKKILEAEKKRLGWYNPEQEADELSLELLHLAGLNPNEAMELQYRLIQVLGTLVPLAFSELTTPACLAWARNQWRDETGRPVFVPVGGFHDAHHSSCFRAFNLWREQQTHEFFERNTQAGSKPMAYLPPAQWTQLVTHHTIAPSTQTAVSSSPRFTSSTMGLLGSDFKVGCGMFRSPVSRSARRPPSKSK